MAAEIVPATTQRCSGQTVAHLIQFVLEILVSKKKMVRVPVRNLKDY